MFSRHPHPYQAPFWSQPGRHRDYERQDNLEFSSESQQAFTYEGSEYLSPSFPRRGSGSYAYPSSNIRFPRLKRCLRSQNRGQRYCTGAMDLFDDWDWPDTAYSSNCSPLVTPLPGVENSLPYRQRQSHGGHPSMRRRTFHPRRTARTRTQSGSYPESPPFDIGHGRHPETFEIPSNGLLHFWGDRRNENVDFERLPRRQNSKLRHRSYPFYSEREFSPFDDYQDASTSFADDGFRSGTRRHFFTTSPFSPDDHPPLVPNISDADSDSDVPSRSNPHRLLPRKLTFPVAQDGTDFDSYKRSNDSEADKDSSAGDHNDQSSDSQEKVAEDRLLERLRCQLQRLKKRVTKLEQKIRRQAAQLKQFSAPRYPNSRQESFGEPRHDDPFNYFFQKPRLRRRPFPGHDYSDPFAAYHYYRQCRAFEPQQEPQEDFDGVRNWNRQSDVDEVGTQAETHEDAEQALKDYEVAWASMDHQVDKSQVPWPCRTRTYSELCRMQQGYQGPSDLSSIIRWNTMQFFIRPYQNLYLEACLPEGSSRQDRSNLSVFELRGLETLGQEERFQFAKRFKRNYLYWYPDKVLRFKLSEEDQKPFDAVWAGIGRILEYLK